MMMITLEHCHQLGWWQGWWWRWGCWPARWRRCASRRLLFCPILQPKCSSLFSSSHHHLHHHHHPWMHCLLVSLRIALGELWSSALALWKHCNGQPEQSVYSSLHCTMYCIAHWRLKYSLYGPEWIAGVIHWSPMWSGFTDVNCIGLHCIALVQWCSWWTLAGNAFESSEDCCCCRVLHSITPPQPPSTPPPFAAPLPPAPSPLDRSPANPRSCVASGLFGWWEEGGSSETLFVFIPYILARFRVFSWHAISIRLKKIDWNNHINKILLQ